MTLQNLHPTPIYDTLILGGGQAGLAMGYELQRRNRRLLIIDQAPTIGHSWETRWDSLRLFTPVHANHLPGLSFPGNPNDFPTKDAVVAYLRQYVAHFQLPMQLDCRVERVVAAGKDTYRVETTHGHFITRQLVIATGPFQKPALPPWATTLDPAITQLHSSDYRNPQHLPAGHVLVVGAGNSGVQIAEELHRFGYAVTLAVGRNYPTFPAMILGKTLFWWLDRIGYLRIPKASRLGQRLSQREILIGTSVRDLKRMGVSIVSRLTGHTGRSIHTATHGSLEPRTILWATGYHAAYPWLDLPVVDQHQQPIHDRGITPLPGVVFLGLPWQHRRGSALLGGVGDDAAYLAEHLVSL